MPFADGSDFELGGLVFELKDGSFTREDQIRYIERRIAGYMEGAELRKSQAVKLEREATMWKAILASMNEQDSETHSPEPELDQSEGD